MIKHIPLNQNILQSAVSEIDRDNCLLLFPTRKSKKEAQKLYQQNWDFSQQTFLTIDEWKEALFISEKPILKEEKRTLALYQSLSAESKVYFKINSYHQSIEFAHKFFGFWEELLEEQVESEQIADLLIQKQTSGDWQLNSLSHLNEIKQNYHIYLENNGFNDTIFVKDWKNLKKQDFAKIIVVNQFYFTKLENQLFELYKDETVILIQVPKECLNENFSLNGFMAEHIKPLMNGKLQVHTSSDQTQMIAQMATELSSTKKATIIDFQFEKQPYSHLLSNEYFSKPSSYDFSQTRFFKFFRVFSGVLNSVIWEGKPFLISVNSLLDLVTNDDLLTFFNLETTDKEAIRKFIFKLIDNDFRFLDLELIEIRKPEFIPFLNQLFLLIQKYRKVTSIKELIGFLQTDIELDYLFSDLKTKSNLVEVFYQTLADFISLEEIKLVANWKDIFPQKLPENLLKLFLDYLKSKKLKLEIESKQTNFDITTLQDTRNLDFDNLFFLNVVEGTLPDHKYTQFLLSENQRKELGLKTYEDIKFRDKFYFYRLLCSSKKPVAFTRSNLEENVEISSFIEEMKLNDLIEEKETIDFTNLRNQLFNSLLKSNSELKRETSLPENFFAFNFDRNDYKDNSILLSFYKWEKLKNNPFEFYLEFVKGITSRNPEIGEDFSPKLIGTIAHEVITLVWKRLIDVYHSNTFKHNFIHNTKLYVQQAIEHYLQYNNNFKYISPHNFSNEYFDKVFIPLLTEGIENFFYRLHNDLNLSELEIEVLPETEKSEMKYFTKVENLEVYLKGRPDLRIHAKDKKYIFDFKTGSVSTDKTKRYNQQLQFYENICYPIDVPGIINQLNSYLFFVEQEDLKKLSKRTDLKDEIEDTLKQITKSGYSIAKKTAKYEDIDVTRRDLLKKEFSE